MSVYNSIASLTNDTDSVLEIGSVSLAPDQSVLFWNTKSYSADSEVNSIFLSFKIAKSVLLSVVQDGYASVVYDGEFTSYVEFEPLFDEMEVAFDRINSSGTALAQGISLDENKDSRGNIVFVQEKRVGSELDSATHNFSDKTTWYHNSVYVTQQDCVEQDGYTWKLPHEYIVDLTHGKIFNEDRIAQELPHQYRVDVFVDGYQLTQRDIFSSNYDDGYDYILDYKDGIIHFVEDHSGKQVRANYAYATDSTWVLVPKPGKTINIERSEVQFASNFVYNDAIDFEIWAYNPFDLPNKVLIQRRSYKSIHNFIDEARGSYPVIPAVGGSELGTVYDTIGFPFNYNTIRQLSYSQGVELRIKTRNDRELGGDRTTATFYCTVQNE